MPKYVVRHGVMRTLGVFSARGSDVFLRGAQVIARTQRGLELGEVLCEANEQASASLQTAKGGQILRAQTEEDLGELRRLLEQEQREYEICRQRIAELGLEMKLIDVEHLYGGERVVVYYLAEGRIDFRQLVKVLAKEFQTRIEMRQIGVRDEAKLLADYGDCGKPVCCNTHLSEMPPVSMRMAKLQKATLDPSKISGRCGRLKCCLRYEYDTYQELQKDLPPVGSEIITNKGRARVLAQEILAGQLLVETEDLRRVMIDAAEVLTIVQRGSVRGKPARRGGSSHRDSSAKDAARSSQVIDRPQDAERAQADDRAEPSKPGERGPDSRSARRETPRGSDASPPPDEQPAP
jgi:cell fate regulator YaaT (PSP1 superfamily)